MFVDTMTELIANPHDLEKVERDYELGKRHLTHGVQPAHFDAMGEALIAVLDESCHYPSDEVTLDKEERDAWLGSGVSSPRRREGTERNNWFNPGSRGLRRTASHVRKGG